MQSTRASLGDDIAQAAWLYYVGQLSQQEVSETLGVSRFKVVRMLAEARHEGMVRISVEHRTSRTLALADRLVAAFGLSEARVAPVPAAMAANEEYARTAVGILGAAYLERLARLGTPLTIGVGWGRTLSSLANTLARVNNPKLTFVSLMGTVSRATHTAPGDVCVRLAEQTGGGAVLMPVPFVADSPEACAAMLEQRLVQEALEVARSASHALMSVGECRDGAILYDSGIFSAEQIAALNDAGVVGDCCGSFYRADGSLPDIPLNRCAPKISNADLAAMDTVLLAGGFRKRAATLAVLRAGFVRRLFVDETLGLALLDGDG